MKDEKETALSVTSTESGSPKESDSSISNLHLNVKCKTLLDLRTEIFMLNMVAESLNSHYAAGSTTSIILSDLIRKCMEANEA